MIRFAVIILVSIGAIVSAQEERYLDVRFEASKVRRGKLPPSNDARWYVAGGKYATVKKGYPDAVLINVTETEGRVRKVAGMFLFRDPDFAKLAGKVIMPDTYVVVGHFDVSVHGKMFVIARVKDKKAP